jgi:hypothetical protein
LALDGAGAVGEGGGGAVGGEAAQQQQVEEHPDSRAAPGATEQTTRPSLSLLGLL